MAGLIFLFKKGTPPVPHWVTVDQGGWDGWIKKIKHDKEALKQLFPAPTEEKPEEITEILAVEEIIEDAAGETEEPEDNSTTIAYTSALYDQVAAFLTASALLLEKENQLRQLAAQIDAENRHAEMLRQVEEQRKIRAAIAKRISEMQEEEHALLFLLLQ